MSAARRSCQLASILLALVVVGACAPRPAPAPAASAESAEAFIARVNTELAALSHETNSAGFTLETFITPDTQFMNAKATERYLAYLSAAVAEAKRFDAAKLTPASARAIMKLRLNVPAPAPDDAKKRARLTELEATLLAKFGEGKYCPHGAASCKNLDQLSETLASSRNYAELTEAWQGWHDVGAGMREDYAQFVELANAGARELGFKDLGVMWRAGYDMPPEEFDALSEHLWQQVKPLYDSLHCYARARLAQRYGADKVPPGKPIPAQLLGNMWAQHWGKIYPDILKPYPKASIETADRQLAAQKWDATRMTHSAESFYASLGFPPLPQSFWERSMLARPRDREVVCHPNAWDVNPGDVRIKACLTPTEADLLTIYHELGHVYYYISYAPQPYLFRDGANDGFHEAIGDTINLSVTPEYLAKIGLISAVKESHEALINQQMKMALEKVAFLPFGRLIDAWRWKVFAGEITSANYNSSWWELRRSYQGIAPPVARSEANFDPGAKFHIPENTPYMRYFLSFILQFQFHKALCAAAGQKGPLYECSNYGSTEAGRRFADMLALGASVPWQDALEKLTGTRTIDAAAMSEYFAPLAAWLKEQNQGQTCGW